MKKPRRGNQRFSTAREHAGARLRAATVLLPALFCAATLVIAALVQPMAQAQITDSTDDASATAGGSSTLPRNKTNPEVDLTSRSLEDLMNIQVTSVSKREAKLSRTPAAIFVITQQDIRRSTATNIADLLRMVPGLDVAQINANTWAVSARGFNQRFTNKLLVLVDGRSVYTLSFGGVFWDVLTLPLEDIERIEVIRGPGGSVWGANAVNGVINIITKKASETKGAMLTAGGGNLDQGSGTSQYGGGIGGKADYRIYAEDVNQAHLPGLTGGSGADGWRLVRGGFRLDDAASASNQFTLQGGIYTGSEGDLILALVSATSPAPQPAYSQVSLSGGFLQGTWNHKYSNGAETILEVNYQQYQRNDVLRDGQDVLDVDFQHHLAWGGRQDIVWGLSYRLTESHSAGDFSVSMYPADLFSGFIQDELALAPNRLYLSLGVRVEHNTFSGFAAMPTARATWLLDAKQTVWAAVSRAVRTPAENDVALRVNVNSFPGPGGAPVVLGLFGNSHFQDERLLAYEMGYRASLRSNLSVDLAAYYNQYSQLRTVEPSALVFATTPPPPHLVLPLVYENLMHGETHGFEAFASWHATDHWTLSPGYALEQIHMHLASSSQDTTSVGQVQGSSPVQSGQLRSHVDLPHGFSWDASAYFVGRLSNPQVSSYTGLDTGLSWQFREHARFSIAGQNLLRDRHEEFVDPLASAQTSLVKRSVYARLMWQF